MFFAFMDEAGGVHCECHRAHPIEGTRSGIFPRIPMAVLRQCRSNERKGNGVLGYYDWTPRSDMKTTY
jgi:hypothetical protein